MTSEQIKTEIVARLKDKVASYGIDEKRACILHAALLPPMLLDYGIKGIIQAGSAGWRFKAEDKDDGGPTHYSYVWDLKDPLTIQQILTKHMPEMHCWVGIIDDPAIIDTTTEHLIPLLKMSMPNEVWSAPKPPPFIWHRLGEEQPMSCYYEASMEAIKLTYAMVKDAWPDVFEALRKSYVLNSTYSQV